MKRIESIACASPEALARAAADQWLDAIEAANHAGTRHCVALSGGRIAQKFFSATAAQTKVRAVSFARVRFFWADERCVPPQDPESNFRIAQELLFLPLGIPENQICRVRGEDPPDIAAARAEADIVRHARLNNAGQPVLDLIFLGLGEDGHVASLFPGEPEDRKSSPAIFRAIYNSPKPPPNRISLGYGPIAAAQAVWVLASGAGKEKALYQSLQPDGATPLARVIQSRSQTRIFTDNR